MGFSYVKNRDQSVNGVRQLICDTADDVALLPTSRTIVAPGSKATVIETGDEYILNTEYVWTLCRGDSGGGGAEKFVVTLTQEDETLTTDKSIAEICEAADANKVVVARFDAGEINIEIPIYGWQTPSVVGFLAVDGEGGTGFSGFNDGNADAWEQETVEFIDKNDFPADAPANANKFIGFDENGEYTAINSPLFKVRYVVSHPAIQVDIIDKGIVPTMTYDNNQWSANIASSTPLPDDDSTIDAVYLELNGVTYTLTYDDNSNTWGYPTDKYTNTLENVMQGDTFQNALLLKTYDADYSDVEINVYYNGVDPEAFTATTSTAYTDILQAMEDGIPVCAVATGISKVTLPNAIYSEDDGGAIAFSFTAGTDYYILIHAPDDTITIVTPQP